MWIVYILCLSAKVSLETIESDHFDLVLVYVVLTKLSRYFARMCWNSLQWQRQIFLKISLQWCILDTLCLMDNYPVCVKWHIQDSFPLNTICLRCTFEMMVLRCAPLFWQPLLKTLDWTRWADTFGDRLPNVIPLDALTYIFLLDLHKINRLHNK